MEKLSRPQPLTELAEEAIRTAIIEGQLKFGDHLSEARLSRTLGISKTPVREALLKMKSEGLIETHAKRGTYVFRVRPEDIDALCEAREVLELAALRLGLVRSRATLAAHLAAVVADMRKALHADDFRGYQRLDAQFHRVIVDSAGNSYLVEAYAMLDAKIATLRTRVHTMPNVMSRSLVTHARIAKLVGDTDTTALMALLADHVRNTGRFARRWLDEQARIPATTA
ncbi:MAG: GntR family transcriptional regulator [Betaproteobacteria bacterium]